MNEISYKICVNTSGKSHGGTDDKVFMIICGDKNVSKEFRFDTPKDNFEGGKDIINATIGNAWFASEDLGNVYGVSVRMEGHDGWWLKGISIERKEGHDTKEYNFPFDGFLGEKGDGPGVYELPKERKSVFLWKDGVVPKEADEGAEIMMEVDRDYFVQDRRGVNSGTNEYNYSISTEISAEKIYESIKKTSKTVKTEFIMESGKLWTPKVKFGIGVSISEEEQTKNANLVKGSTTVTDQFTIEVPVNTLYIRKTRVLMKMKKVTLKANDSYFDAYISLSVEKLNYDIKEWSYKAGEEVKEKEAVDILNRVVSVTG
ncbi:PLAT/LH2 domain-containing protein [Limibacter armeniacum]|uniref:PLAT/LH2 domain-containing protein n=1 Tax=Limibacter armeniacum TaxID=466084 RepID=UPI002FE548CD